MKWKVIISLFVLVVGSLVGLVRYYGFDWNVLANLSFYENLANPSMRIVRIQEGLRKEEVANVLEKKLGWDEEKKQEFVNSHLAFGKTSMEGYLFPKTYMINKDSAPEVISKTMLNEFNKQTGSIVKAKSTKIINPDTALMLASIIQRESGGKGDMKLISGILWNRIFKGMKLQVDATLQYAKGNEEDGWWPSVKPEDKKIESPYNTYKYQVPPAPIANPGLSALEAAYNPQKTSCLFFLHDKKGQIHCSSTYDGHKKNISKYY